MTRKIKRNDPCHCGSGKKYKKCCLMEIENPYYAEKKFREAELERWNEYKKQNPDAEPGEAIKAYQQGMSLDEYERSQKPLDPMAQALIAQMMLSSGIPRELR